jgi:asparagine synthase (glutamine-hydrolysing)
MGVKPLYWWHEDGLAVFGSEIKAILEHRFVPNELYEPRIVSYIAASFDDIQHTFFENIYRLPPGTCLKVDQRGSSIRTYWKPDPTIELQLDSDQAYADRFRELFIQAVESRMRGSNPIGSTLSGGLDSSAVACTADHINNKEEPIHTFSNIFEKIEECDEREYIEAVLNHGQFESNYISGDNDGPLSRINEMSEWTDQPFFGANLFLHRTLFEASSEKDVQILLDGFDGDSTVSHGYGYLTELASSGNLFKLLQEARAAARMHHFQEQTTWELLWNHVVTKLAPEPLRVIWRGVSRESSESNMPSIINEKNIEYKDSSCDLYERDNYSPPKTERQRHYNQLRSPFIVLGLEIGDKIAARYEVEPRYPFCDKRLVEFCLSLPANQKIQGKYTRSIQRRGLSDIYPEKIRLRTSKTSLQPNFEHGLFHRDRDKFNQLIDDLPPKLEQVLDRNELTESLNRVKKCNHTPKDTIILWRIATISQWLSS